MLEDQTYICSVCGVSKVEKCAEYGVTDILYNHSYCEIYSTDFQPITQSQVRHYFIDYCYSWMLNFEEAIEGLYIRPDSYKIPSPYAVACKRFEKNIMTKNIIRANKGFMFRLTRKLLPIITNQINKAIQIENDIRKKGEYALSPSDLFKLYSSE